MSSTGPVTVVPAITAAWQDNEGLVWCPQVHPRSPATQAAQPSPPQSDREEALIWVAAAAGTADVVSRGPAAGRHTPGSHPDHTPPAALHRLADACKVPVQIKEVLLAMLRGEQQVDERTGPGVITPALLQQQRVDLAQLVAWQHSLQCCCVGKRWLAPIQPHLQHLAAASSAGTFKEAVLKHIGVTLATWDAVWELEEVAEVSMERQERVEQLVVFLGAAGIGTRGGWGADAVLRACCKVPHAARQPHSQQPQSQGQSTPPPAKRRKRTKAEQAAEPTQPNKGTGKGKGNAAKARPTPLPGNWLDRDCNAAIKFQAGTTSRQVARQGQQTVPAMSQSDMQHQAAVDGSASATDGYSPAGEAPPPATRLLDLPPALLDDIAGRVMQLSARSLLPLTCRAFSQARLLHVPTLRIQLLTPRVVAALQVRTSKLSLTLWQPETEDSEWYDDLLAHTLPKLDKCAVVERLVDSFPGLTALVLSGHSVTSSSLASLLSHPQLSLQLQQLELYSTTVKLPQQPGSGLVTLDPFQGARLKQLRLEGIRCHPPASRRPLPNLQPLAQHLNQLHLKSYPLFGESPGFFGEYLQPLAQLQVLTLSHLNKLQGVTELLQVLPQLHILQLPGTQIKDHQQLDTLLAATQITSLQLRGVEGLDASYADREE
ncbi:hypothetical protein QJQ45_006791 [Haematococcus lacustris]|nr:hypothetical protein QJQ45_006791 [Haematococcus lacustris]